MRKIKVKPIPKQYKGEITFFKGSNAKNTVEEAFAELFKVDRFFFFSDDPNAGWNSASDKRIIVEVADPTRDPQWFKGYYGKQKAFWFEHAAKIKAEKKPSDWAEMRADFDQEVLFAMLCEAGFLEPGVYLMEYSW